MTVCNCFIRFIMGLWTLYRSNTNCNDTTEEFVKFVIFVMEVFNGMLQKLSIDMPRILDLKIHIFIHEMYTCSLMQSIHIYYLSKCFYLILCSNAKRFLACDLYAITLSGVVIQLKVWLKWLKDIPQIIQIEWGLYLFHCNLQYYNNIACLVHWYGYFIKLHEDTLSIHVYYRQSV